MVEKEWLFSPSTQVSQYILGLNSRTYELLVPLRSFQHATYNARCLPNRANTTALCS